MGLFRLQLLLPGETSRKEQRREVLGFELKYFQGIVTPDSHSCLCCPKPGARGPRGAAGARGELRAPRAGGELALRPEHPALRPRRPPALEHPPQEEDTAGQVGGEPSPREMGLTLCPEKWDLPCASKMEFTPCPAAKWD